MTHPTHAISVRQPRAWLIIHAGKDIENRSWATNVRGPVWIHAAKAWGKPEREARQWVIDEFGIQIPDDLERGAVIGSVDITGCVQKSESRWFFGRYGFELSNPKPLPQPFPCQGKLGFFTVPGIEQVRMNEAPAVEPVLPPDWWITDRLPKPDEAEYYVIPDQYAIPDDTDPDGWTYASADEIKSGKLPWQTITVALRHEVCALEPLDQLDDPEYQAFVEDLAGQCHCLPAWCRPCDGLLAGGFCDGMDWTEDEE